MSGQAWLFMLGALVFLVGFGLFRSSDAKKDILGKVIGVLVLIIGLVLSIAMAAALLPPQ